MIGLKLGLGLSGGKANSSTLSASITGLTAGIAVIGDHASVSAVMSDASLISAYAWGVSKADVDGTPSLGTGANPTDYAAGDGGSLWLKATAGGVDYYASAAIEYAAPVAGLALSDQLFQDDTGSKTYDVSGDFTGDNLTFSLTTPITGVSINSTTGVVTFDTDAMALQFETSVAVKATNSGGDDISGFSVTIGDVPSQMAAPAVSSASDTSISVDRAAAPANNNAAITSYDLRWSTDESTWTTVTGITDPKTITGLTISTLYYVQTRAVNGFGAGAWSTSGSATTAGDATAPIISAATYDDVDTINITLDEGGTCYYMIDDNATRTAVQVETGGGEKSGSFAVTPPTDSEVVDFSGVTAGNHYLHIMVKDAAGNRSNVVSAQYTFVAADTTAPVLTSATDAKNGSTASTGSVSTDEGNGTLYWVVTTSATAPSKAQVKAGQDNSGTAAAYAGSQAVTATGAQNVTGTGLTASTAYTTHFMHEDAAANQSTVVSASGFTTDAASATPSVKQSAVVINSSSSLTDYTGSSFTVGSGTNRVLVAVIHGYMNTAGTLPAATVTFGGVAMTERLAPVHSGNREYGAIYTLTNPTAGAGTLNIVTDLSNRAMAVTLYEVENVDQTTPAVWTGSDTDPLSRTAASFARTTAANNALLISGLTLDSGALSAEIGITGGATIATQSETGILASSDVSFASAYELVATAGADGHGYSWTTADVCTLVAIELAAA